LQCANFGSAIPPFPPGSANNRDVPKPSDCARRCFLTLLYQRSILSRSKKNFLDWTGRDLWAKLATQYHIDLRNIVRIFSITSSLKRGQNIKE
jgi:hypothetical protein